MRCTGRIFSKPNRDCCLTPPPIWKYIDEFRKKSDNELEKQAKSTDNIKVEAAKSVLNKRKEGSDGYTVSIDGVSEKLCYLDEKIRQRS